MPYYRVRGKWFHLEYSHHFEEVVKAASPRAAIIRLAKDYTSEEHNSDIDWYDPLPRAVSVGQLKEEPGFWVGGDQIYAIRYIEEVKPARISCPTCGGAGKTLGYVLR